MAKTLSRLSRTEGWQRSSRRGNQRQRCWAEDRQQESRLQVSDRTAGPVTTDMAAGLITGAAELGTGNWAAGLSSSNREAGLGTGNREAGLEAGNWTGLETGIGALETGLRGAGVSRTINEEPGAGVRRTTDREPDKIGVPSMALGNTVSGWLLDGSGDGRNPLTPATAHS